MIDGACADPVNTLSALVAGGSFATDCLFLVLADPCDEILIEHPRRELGIEGGSNNEAEITNIAPQCSVHMFLYADDLVTLTTPPRS